MSAECAPRQFRSLSRVLQRARAEHGTGAVPGDELLNFRANKNREAANATSRFHKTNYAPTSCSAR